MKPVVPLRIATGRYTPFLRPGWGSTESAAVRSWQQGAHLTEAPSALAVAVAGIGGGSVVPTASGRSALRAVLESSGLPAGSEVVLSTYCCAAVAEAVLDSGCRPVLADVDDELNLTLASVEAVAGPDTSALIIVHLGGVRAADGEAIDAWARERGLLVIEDAAQAVPGVGAPLGHATVHSTGPGKVLFGPGGGWVRTDAERAAAVAASLVGPAGRADVDARLERFLDRYPLHRSGWHDLRVRVGDRKATEWQHGKRSTEPAQISGLDAAIALGQLARADEILAARRRHAGWWRELLVASGVEVAMATDPGAACKVWVRTPEPIDGLAAALWQQGVEVERMYTPLHLDPRWADGQRGPLPSAEELAPRVVALPCRSDLDTGDWRRIERAVSSLRWSGRRDPRRSALAHGEAGVDAPRSPARPGRNPRFQHDQRRFFDELITTQWDTYADPVWDHARRSEVEAIARVTGPVATVLDVGCGCGFHDVELARQLGGTDVVGIDSSPRSIEVADREYPHERVHRRVDDVFTMVPGGFDLVVSFQVIEHVDQPDDFLRACAAQAAVGGHVAVVTPNRRRLPNRVFRLIGRGEPLADDQHFDEYTFADLAAMGRRAGLRVVGTFGRDVHVPFRGRRHGLLPVRLGRRLGALAPPVAEVIGVVFAVEEQVERQQA